MWDACKGEICVVTEENCQAASDQLKLLSFSETNIDSMRAELAVCVFYVYLFAALIPMYVKTGHTAWHELKIIHGILIG